MKERTKAVKPLLWGHLGAAKALVRHPSFKRLPVLMRTWAVLFAHANARTGETTISLRRVVRMTGSGDATRAFAQLRALGLVEVVERRPGRSSVLRVFGFGDAAPADATPTDAEQPARGDRPRRSRARRAEPCDETEPGGYDTPAERSRRARPSTEPASRAVARARDDRRERGPECRPATRTERRKPRGDEGPAPTAEDQLSAPARRLLAAWGLDWGKARPVRALIESKGATFTERLVAQVAREASRGTVRSPLGLLLALASRPDQVRFDVKPRDHGEDFEAAMRDAAGRSRQARADIVAALRSAEGAAAGRSEPTSAREPVPVRDAETEPPGTVNAPPPAREAEPEPSPRVPESPGRAEGKPILEWDPRSVVEDDRTPREEARARLQAARERIAAEARTAAKCGLR